ncbi:PREDICTED: methyl farnesoate epoxidase-like isoform X2 [Dinoponera quadriceps]|uniref:Methyl farnesoate epoxidase-like isoform X2 n=1 Tax=Dinoponera quadriceps TaxID=609295 RepID=A0A6P3XDS2_DINQU|nr:PREDICTED: methyl farnesoate epoxidase-like isoform X2 [Dinoponera quadriceps]
MIYLVICLFSIIICLYYIFDCLKPKNYPPGPIWLPLLGCFPIYRWLYTKHRYNYLVFQKLSRTYGPILGLKLGKQKIVVISTHDLVKQALLKDEFNGRPDGFFFRVRSFGKRKGVVFTDGAAWSQCRRFTMRHLRTFGVGQLIMKQQLTLEAENLVNYLRQMSQRGAVQMNHVFDVAVLNSLWSMFAGHRFEYDDEKLQQVLTTVHEAFRLFNTMGGIVSQMPFLRFVMPELSGYNDLMRILKKLWRFLDEEIEVHERELSNNQPGNLIDAFLLRTDADGNENFNFDPTTFLFLSLSPTWLKLLQSELDSVVGRSRAPTEEDLPRLPMAEAFLAEIHRYFILAPLGIPHRAMKDVILNGYNIPKDTIVLFDFHSVHYDEMHWDKPNEFLPQRFLDEEGKFRQNNASIPFGLGKRRCLGETLARSSVFLFFTYVIHYFDLKISNEYGKPDTKAYDGFTISPKPYYVKLSMRSDLKD